MTIRGHRLLKVLAFGGLGVLLVSICAAAVLVRKPWAKPGDESSPPGGGPGAALALRGPDTIGVPPEVQAGLGITISTVQEVKPRAIEMYGQLIPDPDRLLRIRLRFPAQVISIAQVPDDTLTASGGGTLQRPLRNGDQVLRGQELALVYSTDLGQQKSELVDNLSQLHLDEQWLKELEEADKAGGAIPPARLMTQRRAVEQDRIAANKAESTLRAWEVPDEEIQDLKKQAAQVDQLKQPRSKEQFEQWARMVVRAPMGWGGTNLEKGDIVGSIVEKNATVGEYVDPSSSPPLFQVADLRVLSVVAYPNEDEVLRLEELPRPIHWTLHLMADPQGEALEGLLGEPQGPVVNQILPIMDPNQRTPILQGYVRNPGGRLLSNMGVRANVDLPAPANQVSVPATALVDNGEDAFVFVQPDPGKLEFTEARVHVTRRYQNAVYVRSLLTAEEEKENAEGKRPRWIALRPGQPVVTAGAVELKAALEELQQEARVAAP